MTAPRTTNDLIVYHCPPTDHDYSLYTPKCEQHLRLGAVSPNVSLETILTKEKPRGQLKNKIAIVLLLTMVKKKNEAI